MKNNHAILKIILSTIIGLILCCIVTIGCIWHSEIATMINTKQICNSNDINNDGSVISIDYDGDYYFDDFLAQGGVKNDNELTSFVTSKVTKGIVSSGLVNSACSSFTCKATNGDKLFCRNFDLTKGNVVIYRTSPGNNRYASLCATDAEFFGVNSESLSLMDRIKCLACPYACMDGMNEAGLCCSIYVSCQGETKDEEGVIHHTKTDINTDKPDITSTTLIRLVLDYASNIEEAINLINQFDLHDSSQYSYHYTISDSSGRSAYICWYAGDHSCDYDGTARKMHVIYNDAENPQIVTNYLLVDGYYDNPDDMHGLDRVINIKSELDSRKNTVTDTEDAMSILKGVAIRGLIAAGIYNQSDSVTLYSVVYNMTSKQVTLCSNEHFSEDEYNFTYDFDKFIN